MEALNAAFVGDDGKTVVIDSIPSSTVQVTPLKPEIDYSTARKRPQIGAALAGKNNSLWHMWWHMWCHSALQFFVMHYPIKMPFWALAAFSAFLLGTTLGWSSPVQPQLQQIAGANETTLKMMWNIRLDDDQMSWVGSLLNIGALFGALCGGFLMDTFGRRFILMTMTSPYIIGWLMISLAIDSSELAFNFEQFKMMINPIFFLGMLYVGRIIVGFSGGVCSAIAPCYIGKISI